MTPVADISVWEKAKWAIVGFLLGVALRVGSMLCPLRAVEGEERLAEAFARGEPVIVCFWHNRLAYLIWFVTNRARPFGIGFDALISRSRDGELLSRVVASFGVGAVRGSSSRGGSSGLREMARRIRKGKSVATVGDGPRGPLYELKPGAVALAKLTGAPVLPLAYAAERSWRLDSWDRFIVPKPFSGVAVSVGEPLRIGRRASEEEMAEAIGELQRRLERAVEEAEALLPTHRAHGDRA